VVRIFQSLF